MSESQGSGFRLSLERLYKDDTGRPLPTVYDIMPDGRYTFEPCASTFSVLPYFESSHLITNSDEQPGTRLGENLRRIFLERGLDFFDQDEEQRKANKPPDDQVAASQSQSKDAVNQSSDGQTTESVSPEALSNMRHEILPQLQYVRLVPRSITHYLELTASRSVR